jgi:heme-degrading monooxygenase HmoA
VDARIITVFRSRLRPEHAAEYEQMAEEMSVRASEMPGYIEHKSFTASDGERVTIVLFDSWAHHRAWRSDERHRSAQAAGRDRFYAAYSISVAEVTQFRTFEA